MVGKFNSPFYPHRNRLPLLSKQSKAINLCKMDSRRWVRWVHFISDQINSEEFSEEIHTSRKDFGEKVFPIVALAGIDPAFDVVHLPISGRRINCGARINQLAISEAWLMHTDARNCSKNAIIINLTTIGRRRRRIRIRYEHFYPPADYLFIRWRAVNTACINPELMN